MNTNFATSSTETRQQFFILNRHSSSTENRNLNNTNNSTSLANNRQHLNSKQATISANSNTNNNISIQKSFSPTLASSSKGVINLNGSNHLSNSNIATLNNITSNTYSPQYHNHHQYKLMQQQMATNQAAVAGSIHKNQPNNFAQSNVYQPVQNVNLQQQHSNKNETTASASSQATATGPFYLITPSYTNPASNSNHSNNNNNSINHKINGSFNQNQLQSGQVVSNNHFIKNYGVDTNHHLTTTNAIDSNSYINNSNNQQNYFTINLQQQHHFVQHSQKQQQPMLQPQVANPNNRNSQVKIYEFSFLENLKGLFTKFNVYPILTRSLQIILGD